MIPSIVRRAVAKNPATEVYSSIYKAKKQWPPDFSKLSTKQQFRFERRYKRRAKLKWARPGWTKGVKLAQFGTITFVLIYGVLFLDWQQENQPFQGIRSWFHNAIGSIWTTNPDRGRSRDDEKRAVHVPSASN